MGFKMRGGHKFALYLRQTGEKAVRRGREQMKREADRVVLLAKSYAPVDYKGQKRSDPPGFELERSIRIERFYDSMAHGRLALNIVVGGVIDGVDVDVYALQMHEGLAPYGSGAFQLGPASQAKGPGVGGKFLERAMMERRQAIIESVTSEIRKAT